MNKIRHLAIKTEDTEKLASFYVEVFGLKELYRNRGEGGAIMLTDGYFNLAILPNHDQNSRNGLYHFGFQVDDAENAIQKITKLERLEDSKITAPGSRIRRNSRVRSGWQLL